MCIRSQFSARIADILIDETFIEDADRDDCYDLLQHAIESTFAHPLALASLLTKRGFVDEEVYKDCVKAIGRAVRAYAGFRKNHGDLFLSEPVTIAKPIRPSRKVRWPRGLTLARKYRRSAEERRKLQDAAMAEYAAAIADAPPSEQARALEQEISACYQWPPKLEPRILPPGVVDFMIYRAMRLHGS